MSCREDVGVSFVVIGITLVSFIKVIISWSIIKLHAAHAMEVHPRIELRQQDGYRVSTI
jgi:hypothetical protein